MDMEAGSQGNGNGVRGSQAGISLLEVAVAVVIIGIAASILAATSKTTVTGQLRSKAYGDAATATREVIEEIQLLSLDSISHLVGTIMGHTQGSAVTVSATARGVLPGDVSNFSGLDTSSLRYVTLQTRFRNKAGGTVNKTFTTIVFKP
jgi:prepilin-type N-terminal cleavage/methylation domain-containing protein